MEQLPAPSPETVAAARERLTSRYASGVEELVWQTHGTPLADLDAIRAIIAAALEGKADGPDLAAALVLMEAAHLDLDRLEADLIDSARSAGMSEETIASVLDLSTADAVLRHKRVLARRDEPTANVEPPRLADPQPSVTDPQADHADS